MDQILSAYSSLPPASLAFAMAATFGVLLLSVRVLLLIAGVADLGDLDHHSAIDGDSPFQLSAFSIAVFFTVGGLGGLTVTEDLGWGVAPAILLSCLAASLMVYLTGVMTSVLLTLAHPGASVGAERAVGERCLVCFRIAPKSCGLVTVEVGGCPREYRAYNTDDSDLLAGDEVLAVSFDGQLLHVTQSDVPAE